MWSVRGSNLHKTQRWDDRMIKSAEIQRPTHSATGAALRCIEKEMTSGDQICHRPLDNEAINKHGTWYECACFKCNRQFITNKTITNILIKVTSFSNCLYFLWNTDELFWLLTVFSWFPFYLVLDLGKICQMGAYPWTKDSICNSLKDLKVNRRITFSVI